MAFEKVTDLTAQTSVNLTDTYHVVNTTDTSQDPAGSSYKITWASIKTAILALFSAGTGILVSGGVISSDPTATQTLTNKTLTSPTINTPTITAATIGVSNLTVGSDANGDLYYRTGATFSRLPIGSTNNVLTVNSGLPSWIAPTTSQYNNYLADTGAANAYVITPSPTIGSYATGQVFTFKAANASTVASTLNVNALGAIAIKKRGTLALTANDILAGQIVVVVYDGTNFQIVNPAATNNKLAIDLTGATISNSVTETTLFTTSVPANILATASAIRVRLTVSNLQAVTAANLTIRCKYGATTLVSATVVPNATAGIGHFEFLLAANASTAAQTGMFSSVITIGSGSVAGTGTATEDSTAAKTLAITGQFANATNSQITVQSSVAEILIA